MTGVDFIPSSYHEDRRRRIWFRQRYMTVLLAAAVWAAGTFLTRQFISRAQGQIETLQSAYEQGLVKVEMANQLEGRLLELSKKNEVLERLCPRTRLSAILSELSARVGERVLLTNLRIMQVPAESVLPETEKKGAGPVRVTAMGGEKARVLPERPMCTSVVLTGVAADGGEVADLISRLEESEYFAKVLPGFSKNYKVLEKDVTEFEIRCVVWDFIIER